MPDAVACVRVGQQVIVDNRPSGVTQADIVAKATPDGYTLLSTSNILWVGPLLRQAPYDPIRDFPPITLTANSPAVLLVNPLLAVKLVKELIVLAKTKPGALNYGSAGLGGSNLLPAELFKSMRILREDFSMPGWMSSPVRPGNWRLG